MSALVLPELFVVALLPCDPGTLDVGLTVWLKAHPLFSYLQYPYIRTFLQNVSFAQSRFIFITFLN